MNYPGADLGREFRNCRLCELVCHSQPWRIKPEQSDEGLQVPLPHLRVNERIIFFPRWLWGWGLESRAVRFRAWDSGVTPQGFEIMGLLVLGLGFTMAIRRG